MASHSGMNNSNRRTWAPSARAISGGMMVSRNTTDIWEMAALGRRTRSIMNTRSRASFVLRPHKTEEPEHARYTAM